MKLFFDPLDPADKFPTGASSDGRVFLQFSVSDEWYYDSAWLVLTKDAEHPMWYRMEFVSYEGGRVRFRVALANLSPGLYFYRFALVSGGRQAFFGADQGARPVAGGEDFRLTVTAEDARGCGWFRGAVMYHIFVDRFFRSVPEECVVDGKNRTEQGCAGGEYRAQLAGGESCGRAQSAEGARRNPVRERVFHGNPAEPPLWRPVDGRVLNNDFYGGTLDGIVQKLPYLRTINVDVLYLSPIFEAASSHKYDTGDYERIDPGFGGLAAFRRLVAAAHAAGMRVVLDGVFNHTGDDSRYFNRYGEYDTLGAFQSPQSPWFSWYEFRKYPERYRCWWGIDTLPTVVKTGSFADYIAGRGGIVDRWLEEGVDGWRLDVADELPDAMIARIRRRLDEHGERLLLGEVWEDASEKIAYGVRRTYFFGGELCGVMNYPLRTALLAALRGGDLRLVDNCVRTLVDRYPKFALDNLMNVLSTHDTARAATALVRDTKPLSRAERAAVSLDDAERARASRLQRVAAFLQFTLPGNPCVYYGDEIAMEGAEDPFNRAYFDWARTADSAMLAWYRTLGALRKSLPELAEGAYRTVYAAADAYLYTRGGTLFGVNLSGSAVDFLPPGAVGVKHNGRPPLIY